MGTITVAKTAGFCFGVDRAVSLVYELLAQGKKVCTLGPIIHNPQLVEDLQKKGARIIDTPEQARPDEIVVIRSHGVSADVYQVLSESGAAYADATCPFVAKIHRIVAEHSAQGKVILIAGDKDHPEVKGISGHCKGRVFVFKDLEELHGICQNNKFIQKNLCIMVAQTTYNTAKWQKCTEFIKKLYTNVTIFGTICSATSQRQNEAVSLAAQSDLMVVIGGRHSSNTAKLRDICSDYCKTILVETAQEIDRAVVQGAHKIGITAGASTPAAIIKEVLQTMSEIVNTNEEFNFEEALNESLKPIYTNDTVVGIVSSIAPNEIQVEIGTKHAGYVPLSELTDDPSAKPEDLVKKGDELNLVVLRVNDQEGTVMLSKKKYDAIKGFEDIVKAEEENTILEGTITNVIKGGVLALTNGVQVFIPASQATASRNEPLEDLKGKTVKFRILEVNRGRRRAVGSIRSVLAEERKALEEQFWSTIEIGKVYNGVVKSITSYGAFVDLGGVDGMVHISELSWSKIKHPTEVVNVGDHVEVYIKDIDTEKKKISLGYKKSSDNPWEVFKRDYQVGDVIQAKVVSITSFGAFAQIVPGVDGLIHISQISRERVNSVADVLKVGDVVDVKITEADLEKKRISLSMRAVIEEREAAEQSEIVAEANEYME